VKIIKALSLTALTVLALTAFSGVASASSPSFFVAGSYPATLKGEVIGKGELTLYFPSACNETPAIAASLEKPSEALTPSSAGLCNTSNLSGCELTFHPPAEGINGSFDIGGSKCTGISVSQLGLKEKILPQSGLAATFENEGTGAGAKVKVHAQVTGLKYEVLEGGAKGTYSNGSYTNTWTLSGEHAGSATGVSIHPFPGFSVLGGGSEPAEFHSELYPASIGGEQITGKIGETTYKKLTLTTAAGNLKCETATFSVPAGFPNGMLEDSSELLLAPTYSSCTLAGTVPATVTPVAGCSYDFSLTGGTPYVGNLHTCSTEITSIGSKCKITMANQTQSGMEYADVGSGGSATVEAKANLSGLEYQVANGKECPNSPAEGSYTDGKYKGVISLKVAKVG
jgi:hypothetical protein